MACPAAETKDAACELSTDVVDKSQGTPNAVGARHHHHRQGRQADRWASRCPSAWRWKPGMGLRIGKDPVKVYQYRTCNTIGCIAVTPFDDDLADLAEECRRRRA